MKYLIESLQDAIADLARVNPYDAQSSMHLDCAKIHLEGALKIAETVNDCA